MSQFQESPPKQDITMNAPVPSFRHVNSLLRESDIGKSEQAANVDAFLLYSDDEVRMRAISGGSVGVGKESTSTEVQGSTRKTRLSFELHPSLFCEGFEEINEEDEVKAMKHFTLCGTNEEDAVKVKAMKKDPHRKELVSIILGEDLQSNNIKTAPTILGEDLQSNNIKAAPTVLGEDLRSNIKAPTALGEDLHSNIKAPTALGEDLQSNIKAPTAA